MATGEQVLHCLSDLTLSTMVQPAASAGASFQPATAGKPGSQASLFRTGSEPCARPVLP